MKTIILLFLVAFSLTLTAQTSRIKALSTENTYSGTLMLPVDKSTYSAHKKIFMSTITTYIDGLSASRDTNLSLRLDTLENDKVFESGTGSGSVQLTSGENTAIGDYSHAQGKQTYAEQKGARAFSSGSTDVNKTGWCQGLEFTMHVNHIGTDTALLKIGGTDSLFINANTSYSVTMQLHGVGNTGSEKGKVHSAIYHFNIKNIAGTTTISAIDTISSYSDADLHSIIMFGANDTKETLEVSVASSGDIPAFWYALVKISAIKFD